jgi:hypothetical protein
MSTDDWVEMHPKPIRVRPNRTDGWWDVMIGGRRVHWCADDFARHGLTPPEPPPAPVVVTVELTREEAEAVESWLTALASSAPRWCAGAGVLKVAAAILDHLAAVPGPDCDRRSWWAWLDMLADLTGEQSDGA